MDITIVICSYNRASNLMNALKSFQDLSIPNGIGWEVVVVDNNSIDNTRVVVQSFRKKGCRNFRYVLEKQQGKSHALNRGLGEAKGKIFAFTDDDCIVSADWIATIINEFEADPELSGIGGRVELFNKTDRPVAIRKSAFKVLLSSCSFAPTNTPIIGCNMAFTRKVFEEIGGFDENLGPGTRINAISEDLDFLYRTLRANFKVVYSPNMLVYHNHGRTTDAEVQSLSMNYTVGRGAFYCKHILTGDKVVIKMAYWEIRKLIIALFKDIWKWKAIREHQEYFFAMIRGAVYALKTAIFSRNPTFVLERRD